MEYILACLALLSAIVGIVGAIVPALPGPPISFVGLFLLYLCDGSDISVATLITTGIFAALITVLDYIAPIWLTNKRGGTKYGTRGAVVGMIIGLFFGPLGLILGPFIGAFIGEMIARNDVERAFKVAFLSFIAFMLTTGIKLVYCIILFAFVLNAMWQLFWN